MIRIEKRAWRKIAAHAEATYPNECCGALLGVSENGAKVVKEAVELENAYAGSQRDRYEVRPEDLLQADRAARDRGLDLIGIFHSHPDCEAYFSATDLKNSCPWYSFVVVSVRGGKVDHVRSFIPNPEQTAAEAEEVELPSED